MTTRLSLLFLLFLLGLPRLKAQEITPANAQQYHNLADSLVKVHEYEKAYGYFEQLVAVYESAGDTKAQAEAYGDMGSVKFHMNELKAAEAQYQLAIGLLEKEDPEEKVTIAGLYEALGSSMFLVGRYNKGMELAEKALKILDKDENSHQETLAAVYLLMGNVYKSLGNGDLSYQYMSKGHNIYTKVLPETDSRLVRSYLGMAGMMNRQAKYDLGRAMLTKAEKIAVTDLEGNAIHLAYIYNQLGSLTLRELQAPNEALAYFEKASAQVGDRINPATLDISISIAHNSGTVLHNRALRNIESGNEQQALNDLDASQAQLKRALALGDQLPVLQKARRARTNYYLGRNYYYKLQLEDSEKAFNRAIELVEGIPNQERLLSSCYVGLASIRYELYDEEGYARLIKKSDEVLENVKSNDKLGIINQYIIRANTHLVIGNIEEAREYLVKAAANNKVVDLSGSSDEQRYHSNFHQSEILHLYGIIHMDSARGNVDELHKAQDYFRQFSDHVTTIFPDLNNRKDLVSHVGSYHYAYFDYVLNCHKLFEATGDETYLEEAFNASQMSRAILLKRSITKEELGAGLVPDELLLQEKLLDEDIAGLMTQLQETQPDSVARQLEASLYIKKQERLELLSAFKEDYTQYYDYRYSNESIPVGSLQGKLDRDETLVEFMVRDSTLFSFVIDRDQLYLNKSYLPQDFDSLLAQFDEGLKQVNTDAYAAAAGKLHELLIAPLSPMISGDRLIIIPDASLWKLNFDLLIDDSQTTDGIHYLIRDYAISYVYSSSSLVASKSTKPLNKGFAAFSFSDYQENTQPDYMAMREERIDLPGSAVEVFKLSQQFNGEFFFGEEANEINFKEKAPAYSVLHMAVHGEIDELDYDKSRLYFKGEQSDAAEDNQLFPTELYDMDIRADLAVLSACNSGSGNITRGEGIMSLGRAFQFAGVESLLLSKWEVSDGIAPIIITEFYKNIDEGMPKDKALQLAKLAFLEQADNVTQSPYYWGSFFILGDAKPIKLRTTTNWLLIIGLIGALFSALAIYRIKSRQRAVA